MTSDVLDRLRGHDPAAGLDPSPPDELLARLLADPRDVPATARPPLLRRRPVRIALGATAALALLAGVSAGIGGGGSPDLAARAYAQTQAAAAEILHVVQRSRQEFPPAQSRRVPDTTGTVESWVYGDEAHTIVTSGDADGKVTFTSDQRLGPDGVIRNHLSDTGETQTVKPSDGAEAREIIANSRRDFVADFRSRYERGVLDDDGSASFRGRPARRYVVLDGRFPGGREEYYLDADTGAPLGSISQMPIWQARDAGDIQPGSGPPSRPPDGNVRITVVVERIERLPATPANLANVRER